MPVSEFKYWMAYDNLYPFGDDRNNIHAGLIASTIANVNRGKNQAPSTAQDFMLMPTETRNAQKTNSFVAFLNTHAVRKEDG